LLSHLDGTKSQASGLESITINPNQCARRPFVCSTRIRVTDVLDMLAGGAFVQSQAA